jgi:hypothetical protein
MTLSPKLHALRQKLELGDFFLLLYGAVCVRQYLWAVESQALAWSLTAAISAVIWFAHLATKPMKQEPVSAWFWAIVALPLFAIYAFRAAFPDYSWDALMYHHFLGERALDGFLFRPGDFMPAYLPLNPAADMLTGIFRRLLGFRAGTIINYLALIWCGLIVYDLSAGLVRRKAVLCLGVLAVLLTEQMCLQINTYMVDLLPLPLLLEATRLVLRSDPRGLRGTEIIRFSAFLGLAVAFKFSSIIFGSLLTAAFLLPKIPSGLRWKDARWLAPAAAVFLAPLLAFGIYIYQQTGNPVFPFLNHVFQSPYWPSIRGFADPRWGPESRLETICWPIAGLFKMERLYELGIYSGRIAIGFVAAILALVFLRKDKTLLWLSLLMLVGAWLWSALLLGHVRYGVYLDLIAGLVALRFCALGFQKSAAPAVLSKAAVVVALLGTAQVATASFLSIWLDASVRQTFGLRPGSFTNQPSYLPHLRLVFRDRDLPAFLTSHDRRQLDAVDAWIVSDMESAGIQVLLKKDIPTLPVCYSQLNGEIAMKRFSQCAGALAGKRIATLVSQDNLGPAMEALASRGLYAGEIRQFPLPFFTHDSELRMAWVEVLHRPAPDAAPLRFTRMTEPLPAGAFKAALSLPDSPTAMQPGERRVVYVTITNASDTTWPALGDTSGQFRVKVGNCWRKPNGRRAAQGNAYGAFLFDVEPGKTVEVPLPITAPQTPGEYLLEIDLRQDRVAWFRDRGSAPLVVKVAVGAGAL